MLKHVALLKGYAPQVRRSGRVFCLHTVCGKEGEKYTFISGGIYHSCTKAAMHILLSLWVQRHIR